MALTPNPVVQALAARPETARFGPSRLVKDQSAFKAALTSQLGVSQDILGGKSRDPMALFTDALEAQSPRDPGAPAPSAAPGGAGIRQAAALAALAGNQAATPTQTPNPRTRPVRSPGQAPAPSPIQPAGQGQPAPLAPKPSAGNQGPAIQPVQTPTPAPRRAAQAVQAAVTPGARHPEDLGRLSQPGRAAIQGEGFTREEENLLQAAAAAESRFLAAKRGARSRPEAAPDQSDRLGILSASYESRGSIDAIGYDGRGGTSYGLYQIASGVGTLDRFLDYLDTKAPELSQRLAKAGPGNTGGRYGAMADEWKRISAENPVRFEALQHDFIRETHYQPALRSITLSTGDDLSKRSHAVREVLWSTAVQHGPHGATEIFNQSLDALQGKGGQVSDKALIEEIYARRMSQFGGGRLRAAVAGRLADEKGTALAMLGGRALG
ncbi:hypothetical protein NNJEOMEG_03351 [Fundidesulfovibrio magnetotacticus]|uniref:Type VI secretion system spike protein VgrG3-like C-terminal domain-containing protein n=1 Tax=Fundidesulfovibrio magnetotacticus TaxID=2730080 RepID=A0A6V8M0C5_9BACT|nr:hypothetical protein [Fundidesulfovibrio magnetotacticus]GFK95486.1 hypothetical protein NNJEOMEG_03351 [Fundidesulfovibrio magnetotacticus]